MDILPHQIEPALAMTAGCRRLLIADDVGLGKTIQAALVIAEVCRMEVAPRILVIVPPTLRDQWSDELRQRFQLECWRADRQSLEELSRAGRFGANPWRRQGVWITSPDFLKQRHVASGLPSEPWHLVVVDEAHAVCGDSDRYDVCDEVTRRAHRTVFLTATPHSGDEAKFQRLVALGRLGVHDCPLTIFRRTRADVGLANTRRVRWLTARLTADERRALDGLEQFERAALAGGRGEAREQVLLLLSVLRKRALSTMGALSRSLARRLAWLGEAPSDVDCAWVQPRLGFECDSDENDEDERRGLAARTGLDPRQERSWLRRLKQLADRAARRESKVRRLAALLRRARDPVVVFTEFRDSQAVLVRRLTIDRPVSVLHGEMSPIERRHALHRFLCGDTSVLLATDVAGQGLNLQSRARWVISLELPWNPARLEQRIGRVDRIGQSLTTHLTLLVADHEAEAGLLTHLSRRVARARRSFDADALRRLLPDERVVRAMLLERAELIDLPLDRTPPMSMCRTYVRAARVVARGLERRRDASRRWRALGPQAGGPVWTSTRRLPHLARLAPAGLLVFSVPVLDADHTLVERHIVAVNVEGLTRDRLRQPSAMSRIHAMVSRAAARHLRRASRRARARDIDARPREQALGHLLGQDSLAGELQPGLFDRRELRLHARMTDRRIELAPVASAASRSSARSTELHLGRPVLEAALVAP